MIEIQGNEKAALATAHRISTLFLSSGPYRCGVSPAWTRFRFSSTRTSAAARVGAGYRDPDQSEGTGSFLR
ncbi:hypothetical protein ACFXPT_37915 [Streptomyces goshikiensis]|uniref:hypothetical protein n=1 Tax=Streptomyces goshikiensis TaxID=1942 RepID=UPI0036C83E37